MNANAGKVWLVGAGCSGADLITLRGLSVLKRCQAVVYDDLIDRELLSFAPETAARLSMGKRHGLPSAAQEDICAALIRLSREGKEVVRLKGGDPFVFGRGGEELAALREAGVPCEEIPGVSSAIAIPAAAGIPVTYRRLSQSVHIVTAHTAKSGGLPEDFDRLAGLEGTLVFLMGLSRLSLIVRRLIAAGKAPETPAAVLSGGNALHPTSTRGPLWRLPELARNVQAPAVIVVGPVAALELTSTVNRPLAGLRVGLVGTPTLVQTLQSSLREQGAWPFQAQTLVVRPLPFSPGKLLEGHPWLVFTSANGVRRFFQALEEQGPDIRALAGCRFAAVGAATEQALRAHGIRVDLRPEIFTTAALGEALVRRVPPGELICLLRSAQADGALQQRLQQAGHPVQDVRIYDVQPRRDQRESRAAELAEADYLVFASAGGVRSFLEEFEAPPPRATCVCIGEVTAAALRSSTASPVLTAAEPSAQSVLQAILSHAASSQGS